MHGYSKSLFFQYKPDDSGGIRPDSGRQGYQNPCWSNIKLMILAESDLIPAGRDIENHCFYITKQMIPAESDLTLAGRDKVPGHCAREESGRYCAGRPTGPALLWEGG